MSEVKGKHEARAELSDRGAAMRTTAWAVTND